MTQPIPTATSPYLNRPLRTIEQARREMIEKLERDGRVAVLHSTAFVNWSMGCEGLLFDKDIAEAVLAGNPDLAYTIAVRKYPEVSGRFGQARDIEIEWVPKGAHFYIHEYDGYETVIIITPDFGHTA